MRTRTACVVIFCVACAWAGAGSFQRATVTEMRTTPCVAAKRSAMTILLGASDTPRQENCAEYLLVTPTTVFRVQASTSAPLLLPAEEVSFHSAKGGLVLRRDDSQQELEVRVVCMQLRSSEDGACALPDGMHAMITGRIPR